MALPLYLAMTAAEMGGNTVFPGKTGYMACHFSPYGTGLSNLPKAMPPEGMLILNDRIPICGHDKRMITNQLAELTDIHSCACILLDFQRPEVEETAELAHSIVQALSCPVGVAELYARQLNCPIFLPPVPLDISLGEYLAPWEGREVWLEAALETSEITLTEEGCTTSPLPGGVLTDGCHRDCTLHCHYEISISPEHARFTLHRAREDLDALLEEAETLGVTRAVGLWQELGK